MRYKEFIEGIRMGARDLAAPSAKQYTVGFEFELAVDSDFIDDDKYDVRPGDESNDYEDAWEEFSDNWYSNNSFDFEEWFQDTYLGGRSYQQTALRRLLSDNDIEPRHGYVSAKAQAREQNQKERIRLDKVKERLGDPEVYDTIMEILNDFERNPTKFSRNLERVVDFVHLYYTLYKDDFTKSKEEIKKTATEIIDRHGYTDLESILTKYYDLLKAHFTLNKVTPEDFEGSMDMIYADRHQSDIIEFEDVNNLEDFVKYFTVTLDDLRDYTQDEWVEAESEIMNQEFNDWYNSQNRSNSGSKIGYVTALINDEFNTSASNAGSSKDKWAVIPDGTPGVDAEITTPAFPIEKGIAVMKKMLNIIDDSNFVRTTSQTGLHVNIGTFTGDEANNIDWLKFLMIMDAKRILQRFDRVYNTYAPDKLPEIIDNLQNNDIKNYMSNIQSTNNIVRRISEKYSAINLSKLGKFGIIELRAPGNVGYETEITFLEETIKRIVRALELSSDPNKYKNEYLSMLYKRFGKAREPVNNSVLDNYFSNTFGTRIGTTDPVRAIIYAIKITNERSTGPNAIDPNKGYTVNVNNALMNLLRSYVDNTNTSSMMSQKILDALEKYDTTNKMRSSKMITLVFKELGKI